MVDIVRDLSLHILDLIENSLRASAGTVTLAIHADSQRDLLKVVIEDDGRGLDIPSHLATDPFYTTKQGKKTGLGLSLFKATAERAGGSLELRKSALGGLAVEARMRLTHVDRCPMGDLSATVCTIVCMNPSLDLRLSFRYGGHEFEMRVQDLASELRAARGELDALELAQEVGQRLKDKLPQDGSHPVMT